MDMPKHKISVLEDNEFFNRLLVHHLQTYGQRLSDDFYGDIELTSFLHPGDFIRNLQADLVMAFVDYYLGGELAAEEVVRQIRRTAKDCAIIVVSRSDSEALVQRIFAAGANGFIPKTPQVFERICLAMEAQVRRRRM